MTLALVCLDQLEHIVKKNLKTTVEKKLQFNIVLKSRVQNIYKPYDNDKNTVRLTLRLSISSVHTKKTSETFQHLSNSILTLKNKPINLGLITLS